MAKGRWPTAWFAGAFHREADVELDLLHWKAGSPGAAAGEAFNRRMKQGYNDQGLWRASKSDSFASQLVADEQQEKAAAFAATELGQALGKSLMVRALFTHMGRMMAENRPDEYRKAEELVVRLREELGLTPMSEFEMMVHAAQMYGLR